MTQLDSVVGLMQECFSQLSQSKCQLSDVISKCIRIARLRDDWANVYWLKSEMISVDDKETRDYMKTEVFYHLSQSLSKEQLAAIRKHIVENYVGRRTLSEASRTNENNMCGLSVVEIESRIAQMQQTIDSLRVPSNLSALDAYAIEEQNRIDRNNLESAIYELQRILDRIRVAVQFFLTELEKRLSYEESNRDVFDENRRFVESKLQEVAPQVLEQFAVAQKRLKDDDCESTAHAMLSCRRVLKAVADRLYPARKEPVACSDGVTRTLADDKYVNRLWQYASERMHGSPTGDMILPRINELGGRIDSLYDLASKGVHASASLFEARQCMIHTYLLVSELLSL